MASGVAQEEECLPRKCDTLSSNFSTTKKQTNKQTKTKENDIPVRMAAIKKNKQ
jgi:hypothetical protein